MYAIMKTMCSPGYHQNDLVSTHELRNMMYMMNHTSCAEVHGLAKCIAVMTGRAHCFQDSIYTYYVDLASVRFVYSVCRRSHMTT